MYAAWWDQWLRSLTYPDGPFCSLPSASLIALVSEPKLAQVGSLLPIGASFKFNGQRGGDVLYGERF